MLDAMAEADELGGQAIITFSAQKLPISHGTQSPSVFLKKPATQEQLMLEVLPDLPNVVLFVVHCVGKTLEAMIESVACVLAQ
jgi:hypothetical protein